MEAPMSSSLGAMGPLLRKLDGLLAPDGRRLPKLLKSRIQNLKMDLLEDIVNPFEELSEEKDPDLTTEYWLTEVRELSYDIEDSIDEMIPATVHTDAAAATRSGANARWRRVGSSKIAGLPRMPKRSTRIDKVARLRMDLVWEAIDRHERYVQRQEDDDSSRSTTFVSSVDTSIADRTTPLLSTAGPEMGTGSVSKRQEMLQQRDDTIASANHPSIISQHEFQSPTPCGETSNLVGLDDSRMELMNWIKYEEKKDLKVVSIVGPAGIGKSTLAKELYHEHGKQFRCWAYVRASQKPNVRKLLWDVLAQIQRHQRPSRACNMQSLIDDISSHLQDKRYFIVIDDLWQTTIWDIIVKAFPESNNCSRILITTEMESVALECTGYQSDYIIKMKPLGNVDSTKLFTNIVFGSQRQQNHKEMDKASYEVTRKSGGLPLATTSVAGLARFSASQQTKVGTWSHIHNFLSTTFSSSGSKEMMKETLHFCYNELPQHLKTCLLYLSMYPEGYVISKADLMKQWIAEGFICTTQGKDKEEIAERYFNELINCRLIHASCIKYSDGVISCTVHHMVLDMIKCKSKEANFTTVTDYPHIAPGLSTKVRRLSLQLSSAKHVWKPATITMPHVRSLAFFGLLECLPLVASFKLKFIRVLILEIWGEDNGCTNLDLTRICVFLQLRYLKITSDITVQLPDEIAGLQHLETFEVDARVSSVPLDIIDLPRLSQLRIKDEINLPDGIGGIRSLHTLQYFDLAQNSEKNVQSLGKLSNLRDLHLTCSTAASKEHLKSNLDALSSSLGNLGVLCSLTLAPGASGAGRVPLEGPIIMSSSSVPISIQKLKLLPAICIFSRLPEWMGGLPKLRILKFAVRELLRNDIDHLSQLPALAVLCLHVRMSRVGTVIIDRGSFPALRYFQFRSTALSMAFRAGAMPRLEILKLGFKAQRGKQYGRMLGGIEHLLNLQHITGEIAIASGAGETDWKAAQSAFDVAIEHSSRKWNAVSEHPSFPRVRVKLVDWTVVDEAFAHQDEERSGCLVTDTNRDPAACDKLPFPLDLLPCVISFVSPLDACRCLSVCKAFHAVASRDQVWDRFIPTDYRLSILSRANDPVDLDFASTKKELFMSLSEQHILIDQGNMSFWLDRATGTKSYMLAAKSLNITWGDTPQYWRWIAHPDSRFEEVAELIDVCWLDIIATIDCRELSPDTKYTAYLVFNLTDRSYGLDSPTQEACVTIAGAVSARHTVSLYPHARQHRSRVGSSPYYWPQRHWGDEVEEEDEEDEETEEEEGDEEEDYIEADEDVDDEEEDEQDDDIGVEEDEFEEMEYEEDSIDVEADEDVDDEEEDDIEVEEDECEEMEDEEDDIVVEDECEEMEDEEDDIEVEEEAEVDDEGVGGGEKEARCMQEMLPGVRGSSELLDSHGQEQEKEVVRYPRGRGDGWMEVEMGEFYIENLDDGAVEIRLKEHESLNWKSGLIVEGVEIRPVIRSGKQASAC